MRLFPKLGKSGAPGHKNVVEVGWLLQTDHASFIWNAPRPFKRTEAPLPHAKSVALCPAVIDHETRLFEVTCPFDLHLRVTLGQNGEAVLTDAAGHESGMTPRTLNQLVFISPREQWRHPKRPILQLKTPYTFIADEAVFMTQMPPFLHYHRPRWPGLMIGGRIGIHIWPRSLSWAFEWHDVEADLLMTRGEPWFYVRFETQEGSHIRLVEAELTAQLTKYLAGINGVVNYVNGTFSLFGNAQQRRPERLLVKVQRKPQTMAVAGTKQG
jgi:hypothetical protein